MSVVSDDALRTHLRILASAGSGKTYQLTARYLRLLFAHVPASSILASTFTRAAAGEIRDRILGRVAKAAADAEARAEIAASIDRPNLTRDEVLALLRELCDNLHRLQIRTLDSFFGSIVHAFAIELEIPPGVQIADEYREQMLRQEAIGILLESEDSDRMIRLLRLLTQGASDRAIVGAIDRVVASLYQLARESEPAAWSCIERRTTLTDADLAAALARLAEAPVPSDGRARKALEKDREAAENEDWDGFLDAGLAGKIAAEQTKYGQCQIDPALIAAYRPLIEHASAVLVNQVSEANCAARQLLDRFGAILSETKRRQRLMTFDDVTFALLRVQKLALLRDEQRERFDAICFRIDSTIRHLLLDEFQDTSIAQWRAIEPFVHQLVSGGDEPRSVFCVGDVKQSIYGWRDACPEILDDLPEHLAWSDGSTPIETTTLACSYRSAQTVIDVVNTVFDGVDASSTLEKYREAAERFHRGFSTHETKKLELAGHVQLRTAPRADDRSTREPQRLAYAADIVANLHQQRPSISIGVLTRTNRAAVRLLWELRRPRRGRIHASARGGGPLTDSPSVNMVLDALRMADHPDDTVCAFNVATSPLGEILELDDATSDASRHRVARSLRRQVLERGYADTIAQWMPRLMPFCDQREARRLLQLIDLAGVYDEHPSLCSGDFVRTVELRSVSEIQPAPVQVMTIHQAKGLEFDAVILPDLDEIFIGRPPPAAFLRENGIDRITHVSRWIKAATRPFVAEMQETFERCIQRAVRETLCLLYVGMTRARQSLTMIIDPSSPREKQLSSRPSSLLREALTDGEPAEPERILFEDGDPQWRTEQELQMQQPAENAAAETADFHGKVEDSPALTARRPPERIRLAPARSGSRRGTVASPASALERGARLAGHLRVDGGEALDRGAAIHALFEETEWLDDRCPPPHEAAVIERVRLLTPRRETEWAHAVAREYLDACAHPTVRKVLSRAGWAEGDIRLWRERPFARRADGKLQRGAIDRLVVQFDAGGKALRAQVVDFKSDDVDAAEAGWHAENYRDQMEVYRAAVAEMFGLSRDRIALVLLFIRPGVVVDLGERSESQGTLFG